MRQSAELRALSGVDAGFVGLESQGVHSSGHGVTLAVQSGDPVRVDDVAAGLSQQHLGADGHHELTRRDDRSGDAPLVLHRVVVLPPPLLARHVDDELCVVGSREIEDGAHGEHADHRENQRGDDREGDLECRLAVRLFGDRLAAVLVTPDDVHDRDKDDDADDAGHGEHRPLQIVDHLRVRTLGLPRVLRGFRRARTEHEQRRKRGDRACHTATRHHPTHAKARGSAGLVRPLVIHGTSTSID